MLSIRAGLIIAAVSTTGLMPAHAGSNGLGFPDAGASIRQLNQSSVDRFNDSAAQVRRSQKEQQSRRNRREQALMKERKARQKRENMEREIRQR